MQNLVVQLRLNPLLGNRSDRIGLTSLNEARPADPLRISASLLMPVLFVLLNGRSGETDR